MGRWYSIGEHLRASGEIAKIEGVWGIVYILCRPPTGRGLLTNRWYRRAQRRRQPSKSISCYRLDSEGKPQSGSHIKADLLKTIGHHYGLSKIAINTHFLPQIKNYPLSAGELKSQWSLSDGGNYFILAFRNQENEAQCWLTEKID